ncbi:MAG: hypothetical protein WCQ45_05010, partial [bacterium]
MKLRSVISWEFRHTIRSKQFLLLSLLIPAIATIAIVVASSAEGASRAMAEPPPPFIIALILAMILFMGAFLNGVMALYGVVKEKQSRVVELVLSSISAREMMAGKVIGLGIAGQTRWFKGQVDDLRVWDRARTFKPLLSEADQVEHFVKTAKLDRVSSSRWNLFPCQAGNTVTFGTDPERVPASVETITLSFDGRDARGREVPFSPPVNLRRAEGFQAGIAIPARPGYCRLT